MSIYETGTYVSDVTTQTDPVYIYRLDLETFERVSKYIDEAPFGDCVLVLVSDIINYEKKIMPIKDTGYINWHAGCNQYLAVYVWLELHLLSKKYPSYEGLSRALEFLKNKFACDEYRQFMSSESTLELNIRAFKILDDNKDEIKRCIVSSCS